MAGTRRPNLKEVWIWMMCVNSWVMTFRSQLCVPRRSVSSEEAQISTLLS